MPQERGARVAMHSTARWSRGHSAGEERMTAAVGGMRDEIRGLNERIDKFIVGVFNRDP